VGGAEHPECVAFIWPSIKLLGLTDRTICVPLFLAHDLFAMCRDTSGQRKVKPSDSILSGAWDILDQSGAASWKSSTEQKVCLTESDRHISTRATCDPPLRWVQPSAGPVIRQRPKCLVVRWHDLDSAGIFFTMLTRVMP